MNKFNKIYRGSGTVFGEKSTPILEVAIGNLNIDGDILDLGSGQGRDAVPIAMSGRKIVAVDSSPEAINQLREKARELALDNVEAICSDIRTFEIEQNKYSLIYGINAIPFIGRIDALALIERIKSAVKRNGIIVISAMTEEDGSFNSVNNQENSTYFKKNELGNLFTDFEIIEYFEITKEDRGHPGVLVPHKHGLVRIIARKKIDG